MVEIQSGNPVQKKNPTTHFSSNILRTIVGPEKALLAFQSISTGALPGIQAKEDLALGAL
jgi:hypothetical protein